MSNLFPVMLYKEGGPHDIHGGKFDTLIAHDEAEKDAAQAAGWHLTTDAARAVNSGDFTAVGNVTAFADEAPPTPDDAPPTRAELEIKAKELGIDFDGRTKDKKLAEKIAAKLKG